MKFTSKCQSNYNSLPRTSSRWNIYIDVVCFINAPKETQGTLRIPDFCWSSRQLQHGTNPPFKLRIEEIQAGDSATHNLDCIHSCQGIHIGSWPPGPQIMSLVFSIVQPPHGAFIHWMWSATAPGTNTGIPSTTPQAHSQISPLSYSLDPLGSLRIFTFYLAISFLVHSYRFPVEGNSACLLHDPCPQERVLDK